MASMEDKAADQAAHRAEAAKQMSPVGRRLFKFIEFDPEEELIAEIRKHPIGFIYIAIIGGLIAVLITLGTIVLGANLNNLDFASSDSSGSLGAILIGFGLFLSLVVLIVTVISIILYRLNVVYVTNQKTAEVAYISLFNRKITQLGMGQIEDVTDRKRGVFAYIFNYGTLIIETAGELENATFTMVPNPNIYAQKIIQAHEQSIRKFGN